MYHMSKWNPQNWLSNWQTYVEKCQGITILHFVDLFKSPIYNGWSFVDVPNMQIL
jgi:hypothetical protein